MIYKSVVLIPTRVINQCKALALYEGEQTDSRKTRDVD